MAIDSARSMKKRKYPRMGDSAAHASDDRTALYSLRRRTDSDRRYALSCGNERYLCNAAVCPTLPDFLCGGYYGGILRGMYAGASAGSEG